MGRLVRLFVLMAMAQFAVGNVSAAEDKSVTLGAVYALTGDWSAYGVPSSRGAELYIEQANKNGGVLGRRLRLVIKDSSGNFEKAGEAVQAILSEHPDVAALLGLSESDPVLFAAKAAATAKRVFVTSGATSPKLPAQVPVYLFLACFGDNVQAAAAAQFAFSNLKARSVSIVYDTSHTYTRLLHGYFKSAFEALGGEVRSVVEFSGAGAIATVTDKIKDADIIFLATESPADSLAGVRALRAKGFDQPVVGGDGYDGETVWKNAPELKDIYFSTHAFFGAEHPSPLVASFRKEYMTKYGGIEPASFAGLGYDTAGMLATALKKANSTAPDKVLEALSTLQNFEGVTGTISFVDGSRIPLKSVTILEIAGGKRKFIEQVMPRQVPSP